jgi:hypothetical protein
VVKGRGDGANTYDVGEPLEEPAIVGCHGFFIRDGRGRFGDFRSPEDFPVHGGLVVKTKECGKV